MLTHATRIGVAINQVKLKPIELLCHYALGLGRSRKMLRNMRLFIPVMFLFSACTWVEPTPMGQQVNVLDQDDAAVESCKKLGSVTSMVKHKIGAISRSEEKVNLELATIAQNDAAEMGGDTIAAEGPAENGRRTFSIYKCREQ